MTRIFTLLSLIFAAPLCQAAEQTKAKVLYDYWGLSYQSLFIDTPGISSSAPSALSLSVGHHLENSLALEANLTLPSTTEQVSWNGQKISQKVESVISGRLRKGLLYLNGFEGYGLLGLSFISVDYSDNSSSINQASKMTLDVSYGLGTRFRLGGNSRLTGNIEYNQLLTASEFNLSSLSFGINYYF